MENKDVENNSQVLPKINVYSSHDVTLLPLFFALDKWNCPLPDKNLAENYVSSTSRWPGYGATFSVELYQDCALECKTSVEDNWRGWYIKILLWEGVGAGGLSAEATEQMDGKEGPEWVCPPTSVTFETLKLPGLDDSDILYDDSPVGKGEILNPMCKFESWLKNIAKI